MKTMSIKAKLSAGFGVILVILAVMGLVSYVSLQKLSGISTVEAEKAQARFLATSVHVSINDQKVAIRSYLLSSDESQLTKIETSKSAIAEDFTKLDEIVADSESKRLSAELRKQAEEYYVMCQETAQLHRAGKIKEATDLLFNPEHTALRSAIDKNMGEFVDLQDKLKNAVREEQLATESRTTLWIVGLAIIGVVVGAIVATFTGRAISGGIATMVGMIDELAANNLTVADMEITSQDEVGQAGIALNKMKNNLHAVIEAISGTSMHVATASEELSATSQLITANSEETSAQAKVVSNSTEQVSQNLQTVATGAEEMGSTIKEIAKNATEAAKVASAAVRVAETTTATVSKLGVSSNEIGKVIRAITSIAHQTKLLALNATIEAAQAGEAGKGFAVVANEVKELAKETAQATEDISSKIEAIQTDTKAAVEAIAEISDVINQINGISNTIATAVEEQNATTNEMARNVSEAARGSGEITSNIAGVAQAAESTSRGAGDTQKAAEQLVETSAELRRLVEQFKIKSSRPGDETGSRFTRAAHAGS